MKRRQIMQTQCINEETFLRYAEKRLSSKEKELVDRHLSICDQCLQFLFNRFIMGRTVRVSQKPHLNGRQTTGPNSIWVISNPDDQLTSVSKEVDNLCQFFNQFHESIHPTLSIRADHDLFVSPQTVKERIKKYDIVHYAGHHDYQPTQDKTNGWRLSNGYLTAQDIDHIAGGKTMPLIIFSNACESARTDAWQNLNNSTDKSKNLGHAFLRAGVRHYIGTLWMSRFFKFDKGTYSSRGRTQGSPLQNL